MSKKESKDDCDNILLPPFPPDGCTAERLHAHVVALNDWLGTYRDGSNERHKHVRPECIPKPRQPASVERHMTLSIPRLIVAFEVMRDFRARYDAFVRMFEEAWSSEKARDVMHGLLHIASDFLDTLYLSPEMLEARQEKQKKDHVISMFGKYAPFFYPRVSDDEKTDVYNDDEEDDKKG